MLERDVEVTGIEDLSQFDLNRAKYLILIQPRTDRLSNLREQFVLLRAPVRIVPDHVVLERESQLQRQSHHKPRTRRSKRPTLGMRKQDNAEIVLSCLQGHRS